MYITALDTHLACQIKTTKYHLNGMSSRRLGFARFFDFFLNVFLFDYKHGWNLCMPFGAVLVRCAQMRAVSLI